jgi:hypothetical protein
LYWVWKVPPCPTYFQRLRWAAFLLRSPDHSE